MIGPEVEGPAGSGSGGLARMPTLANHEVGGLSVGGFETWIDLPRLKLCFDIGRCPTEAVKRPTVLFTHAHMDHMGGVAWHAATRALLGMPPPTYVLPRVNAADFERLIEAWRRLDRSQLPHRLVPCEPGDEVELPNRMLARPFHAPHVAPCQGYGLWSRKTVLAPEYEGLPQAEIQRLRVDEGVEVTRAVETPEVAFTGDTTIEVVEREEVVRTARLLIMEVTFLDDRVTVESSRSRGHVHLDEVVERADLFENEAILLTHVSRRYKPDEVRAILDARLPAGLRERVTPLLEGF